MTKKILLGISLLISVQFCLACDICGCGVGSYYVGILPEFSKKIIGLRYRYNRLQTHIGAGGQITYLTTKEVYQTAELWGGWNIGKRFRVMGYIPVNLNLKTNQGVTTKRNWLGDMGAQGFYQLINQRTTTHEKVLIHSLWMGAGIKLPTGRYQTPDKNNEATANIFQLGTGSIDFILTGMYDLRWQDAGINTTVSYKINTTNSERYQYGNKASVNSQAYYKFRVKQKVTIAPNAGVLFESAEKDTGTGHLVEVSGGRVWLGSVGTELLTKNIAIGFSTQLPFSQQLANNFVKAGARAMLHMSFMF